MTKEYTPEEIKYRLSDLGVQIGNIAINYITELEKACDETQELLDKQIEVTYKLHKENTELKEKLKPENCLKLLAKEGYVKFTSEQLIKAKEIIKTFLGFAEAFGYSPSMDKFITEAEQFLNSKEEKEMTENSNVPECPSIKIGCDKMYYVDEVEK